MGRFTVEPSEELYQRHPRGHGDPEPPRLKTLYLGLEFISIKGSPSLLLQKGYLQCHSPMDPGSVSYCDLSLLGRSLQKSLPLAIAPHQAQILLRCFQIYACLFRHPQVEFMRSLNFGNRKHLFGDPSTFNPGWDQPGFSLGC